MTEQTPQTPETPPAPERMEGLPEKFKDNRQLLEAYLALEKAQSSTPPQVPETPAAPQSPETPASPQSPETPGNLDNLTIDQPDPSAPLDFSKYDQEILNTGDLSEASIREIQEKFKLPPEVVASYIGAKKIEARVAVQEIVDTVGGMGNYRNLHAWAKDNLSLAQQEAFNTQLGSPDPEVRKMAVKGLYLQYTQSAGDPEAGLMTPTGDRPGTVGAYRSEAEWQADLRDPRYHQDPAFREEVAKKLQLAMKAGIIQ